MLTLLFPPGAGSMVVLIALHGIGTAFEAGPLFFRPQPSLCGLQRLIGAWLTVDDRRHTSAASAPHHGERHAHIHSGAGNCVPAGWLGRCDGPSHEGTPSQPVREARDDARRFNEPVATARTTDRLLPARRHPDRRQPVPVRGRRQAGLRRRHGGLGEHQRLQSVACERRQVLRPHQAWGLHV